MKRIMMFFSVVAFGAPAMVRAQMDDPEDVIKPEAKAPDAAGTPPAAKAEEKPAVVKDDGNKKVDKKTETKSAKPARKPAPEGKRLLKPVAEPVVVAPDVGRPKAADAPECDNQPACLRSRGYYLDGAKLFEKNDFKNALAAFLAAYKEKPLYSIEFNIARCHQRMGDFEQATVWYRRYLGHTTQPSDMSEAERLIDICEQAAAQQTLARNRPDEAKPPAVVPAPSVPVSSASSPPPTPSSDRAKQWFRKFAAPVGLGLGSLALFGAGGGLIASANADHDRLSASCAPMCDPALIEGPQARASGGIALVVIGGAAAAADVVLWILTAMRKDREAPHAFILVPTGTGVAVSGSF